MPGRARREGRRAAVVKGRAMSALIPLRLIYLRCGERRFVPKAAVSNRSKQQLYSITSSASASRLPGIDRPSALAVLRLITISYLIGACTGKSAGFSPFRIRST